MQGSVEYASGEVVYLDDVLQFLADLVGVYTIEEAETVQELAHLAIRADSDIVAVTIESDTYEVEPFDFDEGWGHTSEEHQSF